MLMKLILLSLLLINASSASILKEIYYIKSDDINISSIIKKVKDDKKLFKLEQNKNLKRIKSEIITKILKKNGYSGYKSNSNYITFKKKSPVDTKKIKEEIIKHYKKNYAFIDIKSIDVEPRGYIKSLPKNFTVEIRDKNYLSNKGIVNIKTLDKKKIFFDYILNAKLLVYITTQTLKKGTHLSALNTTKKSIILEHFKAKPIQSLDKIDLQTKYNIPKNKLITTRYVEELSLIKRGSNININFKHNSMVISFVAKALQEGRMDDMINVEKSNGKRFRVRVIGKNKAEMQ